MRAVLLLGLYFVTVIEQALALSPRSGRFKPLSPEEQAKLRHLTCVTTCRIVTERVCLCVGQSAIGVFIID
jgi:hypothetical protein